MGTVSRAMVNKLGIKPDFEFATPQQQWPLPVGV